jgi:hypothetical protein
MRNAQFGWLDKSEMKLQRRKSPKKAGGLKAAATKANN